MSTQIRTDSAVFFEVFSAQSAGKAYGWRLVEAEREFDKLLRGFVVSMNEGTKGKITLEVNTRGLPSHPATIDPTLTSFLFQLYVPEKVSFGFEIGVIHRNEAHRKYQSGRRSRLIFSTNISEIRQDPLHYKIPLVLPRDKWLNLTFDVHEFVPDSLYLDGMTILPSCRIRRIIQIGESGSAREGRSKMTQIIIPEAIEYHPGVARLNVHVCNSVKVKCETITSQVRKSAPLNKAKQSHMNRNPPVNIPAVSMPLRHSHSENRLKDLSLMSKHFPNKLMHDEDLAVPPLEFKAPQTKDSVAGNDTIYTTSVNRDSREEIFQVHGTFSLREGVRPESPVAHNLAFMSSERLSISDSNFESSARGRGLTEDDENMTVRDLKGDIEFQYDRLKRLLISDIFSIASQTKY